MQWCEFILIFFYYSVWVGESGNQQQQLAIMCTYSVRKSLKVKYNKKDPRTNENGKKGIQVAKKTLVLRILCKSRLRTE